MKSKYWLMIGCYLIGVVLIGLSLFIKNKVDEGQQQITSAQQKIDHGNKLFSHDPISKAVGSGVTGGAQKKIDAGKDQVVFFQQVAQWAQIGGIAFLVIGTGLIVLRKKKR